MKPVIGRTIRGQGSWRHLENLSFENCFFDNCLVKAPASPAARASVRGIRLTGCSHRGCWLYGLAMEDVTVDGLKAASDHPLFLFSCVFKHVTLTGSISQIKFNAHYDALAQGDWAAANAAFYQHVDWALDLSKARFTSVIDFAAIPGSLIKRDAESQVLIRRRDLLECDWQSIDFGGTVYDMLISDFLEESTFADVVLVAARVNRKYRDQMSVLCELRRIGLAQ